MGIQLVKVLEEMAKLAKMAKSKEQSENLMKAGLDIIDIACEGMTSEELQRAEIQMALNRTI